MVLSSSAVDQARSSAGFLHQLRTAPAVSTGPSEDSSRSAGVDSGGGVRGGDKRRIGHRRTKENAMSVTTPTAPTVTEPYAVRRASSLRRTTVVAGLVAAAVATAVAAAVHAAGVSFEVDGEVIPLAGFAQTTFLGAVIGGVVLAVLNRRGRSARRRFLQTTVALTALSCVPSVTWPDDAATKLALVALHVLAAAIVVPALVRHAQD
jgi:Family of unknown function (DUF6069)